jgi:hypothetical protein
MQGWVRGCAVAAGLLALSVAVGGAIIWRWRRETYGRPAPLPPPLPPAAVLHPTFVLAGEAPLRAGCAFAVRLRPGSAPLLLTALHLLGPPQRAGRHPAPAQVEALVREVRLETPGGAPVDAARGALRNQGPALAPGDPRVVFDVLAFALPGTPPPAVLPLAEHEPTDGEWLWLLLPAAGARERQRPVALQVLAANSTGVSLRAAEEVAWEGLGGAPLVNSRGEVAAMLIVGGPGRLAAAIAATSIRHRLRESGVR